MLAILCPFVNFFSAQRDTIQKSNIDTSKNKQFITLVFHTKIIGTQITLNPEEYDAYAWIQLSEINRYKTVEYLSSCLLVYKELMTKPIN